MESWQPPHPMRAGALEKSRQIANAVTDDRGRDGQPGSLGLFGVELFVKGNHVVQRGEPAPTTPAW